MNTQEVKSRIDTLAAKWPKLGRAVVSVTPLICLLDLETDKQIEDTMKQFLPRYPNIDSVQFVPSPLDRCCNPDGSKGYFVVTHYPNDGTWESLGDEDRIDVLRSLEITCSNIPQLHPGCMSINKWEDSLNPNKQVAIHQSLLLDISTIVNPKELVADFVAAAEATLFERVVDVRVLRDPIDQVCNPLGRRFWLQATAVRHSASFPVKTSC